MAIYTHEHVIRITSDYQILLNLSLTIGFDSNLDTMGASASTLIASATTRLRCLHDMTQSDMQAIKSCMYSCMYVACTQRQGHGFIYSNDDYEDNARIKHASAMPHLLHHTTLFLRPVNDLLESLKADH